MCVCTCAIHARTKMTAATDAPSCVETMHRALAAECAARPFDNTPTLRNGISAHTCRSPVSFDTLQKFIKSVVKITGRCDDFGVFVGSIGGNVVLSARLQRSPGESTSAAAPPPPTRKRRRDGDDERVEAAIAAARIKLPKCEGGGDAQRSADTPSMRLASRVLRNILEPGLALRDESVIESCGVSVSKRVAQPGGPTQPPPLIVAARLSAGVGISLPKLQSRLGTCFGDGMITTDPNIVGEDYKLPLSKLGAVIEATGQRSLLLFAGVPTTGD